MAGRIQGFIFDLDGTLLDTLDSLAGAFNRSLEHFGFPVHPTDAYRYFIGDGLRACVERCLPESARNETLIAEFTRYQQADYTVSWAEAAPYPGITELLETLAGNQQKLAVLSNKPHVFTERCIARFFPSVHFDAVLGHQDGVPHKPDPTGAQRVLALLGLPAGAVAYIGDTATDIQTARASGTLPIGVLWGFRDKQELLEAGAQHLVRQPAEILTVTGGI
ncbi:MAG: HAD family hydrolase [Pseudomonadota bacterium]